MKGIIGGTLKCKRLDDMETQTSLKLDEKLDHKFMEFEILRKYEDVRKRFGLFFTPDEVIELMVKISGFQTGKALEPACGLGQFLARILERYILNNPKEINLSKNIFGVESTKEIADEVNDYVYSYLQLRGFKGNYGKIPVLVEDFLLAKLNPDFDLVIGNPPYGILGQNKHYPIPVTKELKEKYKGLFRTWYGKYNIYGLFIEKSVNLLKKEGKLVFIIPATWMILDEFKKLREFLAYNGKVIVYYLGPKVFKDAEVCTVILELRKGSNGLELWDYSNRERDLAVSKDEYQGEIIRFEDNFSKKMERGASYKLGDLFDIYISARSPEVKKNPYVLKFSNKPGGSNRGNGTSELFKSNELLDGYLPILNGRNLKPFKIDYETNFSGYWIKSDKVKTLKSFYLKEHIAVGHTKGGRVVAALDSKKYPWISDVYLLFPKHSVFTRFKMEDIVYILNSDLMNKYARTLYREITPHTTATQLKLLPLYSKDIWKQLEDKYEESQ